MEIKINDDTNSDTFVATVKYEVQVNEKGKQIILSKRNERNEKKFL
jgi:hypothetical protein